MDTKDCKQNIIVKESYEGLFQERFQITKNFLKNYQIPKNSIIYFSVGSYIRDSSFFQIFPSFLQNTTFNRNIICIDYSFVNIDKTFIHNLLDYISSTSGLSIDMIFDYFKFTNIDGLYILQIPLFNLTFYFVPGYIPSKNIPMNEIGIVNDNDIKYYQSRINNFIESSKDNGSCFIYSNFIKFYNHNYNTVSVVSHLFKSPFLDGNTSLLIDWNGYYDNKELSDSSSVIYSDMKNQEFLLVNLSDLNPKEHNLKIVFYKNKNNIYASFIKLNDNNLLHIFK